MVQLNIVNPTFEAYYDNGGAHFSGYTPAYTQAAADTMIPGWTLDSGTVDILGSGWTGAAGDIMVDLAGTSPGKISQDIQTVIGETYTFSISASNYAGTVQGSFEAQINGVGLIPTGGTSSVITPPFTSGSNLAGGAQTYSFSFVATSTTTNLAYARISGQSNFGPAIGGGITPPACFVAGTLITCRTGLVPIEELRAGDEVLTMDNGYQTVRWAGSSSKCAVGDLAPILIKKGTLNNKRDLYVSPQHRILIQAPQAELMFGENEVFVSAKSLINDSSIRRIEGGMVIYCHILFDQHQVIYAEGSPSESLFLGEQGWHAMNQTARQEIEEIFPFLADEEFRKYGDLSRMNLSNNETRLLMC